jgi:molybdenum cofactor guanylyltransferase
MKNITVSILCGGKSSRMESEKGLVLYKNEAFIEHIIKAILPITDRVNLITNCSHYNYLPYKKIQDVVIDKGPIGGIYTALDHSQTKLNLILSCDIPLISTAILEEIIDIYQENFDAAVVVNNGRVHPLIGLYSKEIKPMLKKSIEENDLKMMHLLSKIKHQYIEIEATKSDAFRNINSLVELQELNSNTL